MTSVYKQSKTLQIFRWVRRRTSLCCQDREWKGKTHKYKSGRKRRIKTNSIEIQKVLLGMNTSQSWENIWNIYPKNTILPYVQRTRCKSSVEKNTQLYDLSEPENQLISCPLVSRSKVMVPLLPVVNVNLSEEFSLEYLGKSNSFPCPSISLAVELVMFYSSWSYDPLCW